MSGLPGGTGISVEPEVLGVNIRGDIWFNDSPYAQHADPRLRERAEARLVEDILNEAVKHIEIREEIDAHNIDVKRFVARLRIVTAGRAKSAASPRSWWVSVSSSGLNVSGGESPVFTHLHPREAR